MKFADLFKETIWSLAGNKVRSGLTMLGIIIGIASVIALVAIGQGAQNSISKNIEAIGSNLILVNPGAQRVGGVSQGGGSAQSLTVEDANAIKSEIENIQAVAPAIQKRSQVTAKGNNTNTQILGTTADYLTVRNVTIDSGSFFSDQQMKTSAKVAVIGTTVRDDLFGTDANPIGQTIRINKMDFQVIGMTITKGGSGFGNQDDIIYIPLNTAQHYISGNANLSNISIAATDQNSMTDVQQQITDLLLARHKISDSSSADFTIMNQNDIIATATNITGTFTILLSSIAGISLLVGGIGIMNMMLTTVTERTREIGLRKAIGIRKIYINLQFLSEAIVLTFLGGAIGIFLGWLASLAVTHFISALTTSISLSSIFLAFGVSAGVGIIFGFYPARRAANLSPIEALRYE
ncbi:MAG: ABC transporter, permease protein [Candidatus Moranbacteria bacterium GW2011_GWF2_36_839]|nr:MAG: ABC transporter, permease protein [Candidatus Moranbacteria bacterium GW2011_GWF1_36_78]KKQ17346.1 MAG: ABC transporter, permease protein [Candidatus Moranbacteria bacterium GW2011_GWF2_36_839]HAT73811.1 multidrug ABC transporter substrate-binding protein [Candidatus Moranbacteria bacterium]HBY11046.1 multidrug ABC transporter substrate-binding protein [Candidatus Moranbacteria bacterium]